MNYDVITYKISIKHIDNSMEAPSRKPTAVIKFNGTDCVQN